MFSSIDFAAIERRVLARHSATERPKPVSDCQGSVTGRFTVVDRHGKTIDLEASGWEPDDERDRR